MNREKRGDERALPETRGHLDEEIQQEDSGDAVQQNIGEVLRTRLQTEDLAVDHVRNDCERMPITRLHINKGLRQSMQAQPSFDQRIVVDVRLVIVIDEVERQRLAEDDPDQGHDSGANGQTLQSGRGTFIYRHSLHLHRRQFIPELAPIHDKVYRRDTIRSRGVKFRATSCCRASPPDRRRVAQFL